MENVPFVITNEIATELKKAISSALPDNEDFLIYAKPFLTNIVIRDNYEQLLDILNRAGIKDVEEIIDRIAGFKEVVIDNSPELVQGIINLIQNETTQLEAKGATLEEIQKAIMETMSFENITPLIAKTSNDLQDKYQNGFILFDRNTVELSDDEEILTNYFGLLIAKLFLQYMINQSQISEEDFAVFMKEFLLNYFEGMDALYDEIVPKELITFIEKIKIPNEEKLRAKIVGTSSVIEIAPTDSKTQAEIAASPIQIPQGQEFKTPIKAYSPKELCGLYNMTDKLFRSQVNDYAQEIGQLGKSRIYTMKQVYTIFFLLGDPALKNKTK
ncbi:MAG TPA: hypothetical protein VNG53_04550 [Bacteroidia bacterium]|nr:hypothetical protein [Bacteroidia bacterium]